jgi:hypothetical protein
MNKFLLVSMTSNIYIKNDMRKVVIGHLSAAFIGKWWDGCRWSYKVFRD